MRETEPIREIKMLSEHQSGVNIKNPTTVDALINIIDRWNKELRSRETKGQKMISEIRKRIGTATESFLETLLENKAKEKKVECVRLMLEKKGTKSFKT